MKSYHQPPQDDHVVPFTLYTQQNIEHTLCSHIKVSSQSLIIINTEKL